jgi:far upstream element-binding protein
MADLSNILAALAAQRQGGTPAQAGAPPPPVPGAPYPPPQYGVAPGSAPPPFGLPQPIHSGSVDLAGLSALGAGGVNIADAIAKARGIAAEKGISYDPTRRKLSTSTICNALLTHFQ